MSSRSGHGNGWLWALADVLLVLTIVQQSFMLLALPQINPQVNREEDIPPPGNIMVLACWDPGPIDVDLWTHGPGQDLPTGYPAGLKSGEVWSLLRDDIGIVGDDNNPSNCENAFARATPAGEYVVNIHCFSCPGRVKVHIDIGINGKLLAKRDMELIPKQERTVLAWEMNEAGHVISHDEVFRPLRVEKK